MAVIVCPQPPLHLKDPSFPPSCEFFLKFSPPYLKGPPLTSIRKGYHPPSAVPPLFSVEQSAPFSLVWWSLRRGPSLDGPPSPYEWLSPWQLNSGCVPTLWPGRITSTFSFPSLDDGSPGETSRILSFQFPPPLDLYSILFSQPVNPPPCRWEFLLPFSRDGEAPIRSPPLLGPTRRPANERGPSPLASKVWVATSLPHRFLRFFFSRPIFGKGVTFLRLILR